VKVAFWTPPPAPSGVGAYAAHLAEALRPHVDVRIVPAPFGERDPAAVAETLAQLNDADLVHIQHDYPFWGGFAPGAGLLSYYRRLKAPRVVTAHNTRRAGDLLRVADEPRRRQRLAKGLLSSLPRYRSRLEREPFAGAAAVIVHTGADLGRLLERRLNRAQLRIIPPGVPPPPEPPSEAALESLRRRFNLGGSRLATMFGFVGRDSGCELALQALARLPPQVKLLIAGGDEEGVIWYLGALRAGIQAQGLQDRAFVYKELEVREIPALMALTDVVLAPFTADADLYSAVVALSHGKPVLAADLPFFGELRALSGALELFPPGDAAALADRLGFLLASGGTRAKLAAQARTYAAQRPWSVVAEETLQLYRQVLSQPE